MIQEYALDPELLANEFPKHNHFFVEAFGKHSIRFISKFPKGWRSDLLAALKKSPFKDDVRAKAAVTVFADRLLEKAIKRNHGTLVSGSWLVKAEKEHLETPFHAILARYNPNENASVIPWSEVSEHPKWEAPRDYHPKRLASCIASLVDPLLIRAKEVIFVDPYFDIVADEYRPIFAEYFRSIQANIVTDKLKITIITALRKVQQKGIREPGSENVESFVQDCHELIPGMISSGCTVTIAILKERIGGQRLHDRFILTKNAGIQFGTSLGCMSNSTDSCENLSIYTYGVGESLWELYNLQRQPAAFEKVREPFTIKANADSD